MGLRTDGILGPGCTIVAPLDGTQFRVLRLRGVSHDVSSLLVDGALIGMVTPVIRPTGWLYTLEFGDETGSQNARAEIAAYSFTQPHVVGQNPPAGTLVPNKTAVDLTIVDGPATETVPNLIGLTEAQASAAILAANLTVGAVSSAPSNTIPAGQASDQSPLPNIHVPKDTPVNIVISTGPPNRAPSITSTPSLAAAVDQPYRYQVIATDPDVEDTLTFSLPTVPAGMSINPAGGLIQFTPTADQIGMHSVTVRVTDRGGLSAEQSFVVIVSDTPIENRAPVAVAGLLGEPDLPACVAPPGGLSSWYPGDSSFADIVGISSPTSIIGSPQLVPGKVGQAIKFDGTSGLTVPYNPTFDFGLTDSFTIDAWVRVDGQSGSGDNAIVDRRRPTAPRGYYDQRGYNMDAWLGSLAPVGMTKFSVSVTERHSASIFGQATTRAVPLGEAHFIAGVVDRQKQTIAIYLDGVLEQELSIAHVGEIASVARLFIGHHTSRSLRV